MGRGHREELPVLFLVRFSWKVCPTLWTTGLEVPPSDRAKEENWGSLLLNLEGSFTHVEPTCGHEL